MVDLHSHTDRSDGNLTPEQLVDLARRNGLKALSITDHDSLEGYDVAAEYVDGGDLELICGVELSTKLHGRAIHILGYFLESQPDTTFRGRLLDVQQNRRERNTRLTARLRQLGLSVRLEDAEALGRAQTGRPHFAQVLVKKGYVSSYREAFDRYLDESQPGYVERRDPSAGDVLDWIHEAGGIASWAHPARFVNQDSQSAEELFRELKGKGLHAIEVYHADHSPQQAEKMLAAARKLGLGVTGGSDFHGGEKSSAALGSLNLPMSLLGDLRRLSQRVAAAGRDESGM